MKLIPMKNLVAMTILGATTVLSLNASAVCNQKSASTADKDLWNQHGCWNEYFLWQAKAFDVESDDWSDRGFYDACNVNLEYPKHWNASYLMSYGLADNSDQSFHAGQADYQQHSIAHSTSNWHAHFRHVPTDDTGIFGEWDERFLASNLVKTSCLLYSTSSANANPASRGGDFVHEGTHAWMDRHGFDPSHLNNPPGGHCAASGAACDYFYFHGVGQYAFGAMWEENGTADRFHSPNQAQVEYLCDVADQPQDWVPKSVRTAAALDANTRAAARFINGPGYACGTVRPW